MILSRKQQEKLLNNYIKKRHTQEECIGYIDGVNATLEAITSMLFGESVNEVSNPDRISRLPESHEIRMKARELDEKDFDQWLWETVYRD